MATLPYNPMSIFRMLTVGCDVFLADVPSLTSSLQSRLDDPAGWVVVDASAASVQPLIAPDLPTGLVQNLLRQISNQDGDVSEVALDDGVNLTTVFGILLDYPAVYTFDQNRLVIQVGAFTEPLIYPVI